VADYVDHSARLWAAALTRAGYLTKICRPVDVRPSLLQAFATELLIVAVSHVRGPTSYADVEGRRVPVILVSADPKDRCRAQEVGCAAILLRPVTVSNLIDEVRTVLGAPASRARVSSAGKRSGWANSADGRSAKGSMLRAKSQQLCAQAVDLRRQSLKRCAYSYRLLHRPERSDVEGPPRN
jgi:hypothetical protein